MYKFLVGGKIRFLDDILTFLESKVEQQSEDIVASNTCYLSNKDKFFGVIYSFKTFLPKDKERLYLRVAMIHLENEKLIIKTTTKNLYIPDYLISYDGIILVKNGGYSKKIVLERLKELLQRCAWFTALVTLGFNIYFQTHTVKLSSDISKSQVKQVSQTPKIKAQKHKKQKKITLP
jgi:hypothetical protein